MVLITGAGAGLGLALTRRLMAGGRHHLVATAREESLGRFEEAGVREGARLWIRAMDVTDGGQRRRVVEEVDRELGGVDVLVNNAGIAFRSVLEHVNEGEWLEQMRVNFRGPAELARLVLPAMRARRAGRIVSVSSVGGMMAMPTMALYSASKFALEGAFEALWYEVRPWGIRVTLVQPGFVRSDSFTRTRFTRQARHGRDEEGDPYHAHYREMHGFIERWMRRAWSSPEEVARVIERVMERRDPPLRVSATPDAWVFAKLRRWLPRRWYHRLLYAALPGIGRWGPAGRAGEVSG
ncbi:MAG: SDR family NAD(P)-dependent oxidoreductase [Verrucomicrobiae bacterium]|nr:SDR family NAD(P)-dependent oxidoreductase [Verrucomicrobiae bacterium]